MVMILVASMTKAADKNICMKLLGAAIYNRILEKACDFNGGVAERFRLSYDKNGCRNIISQKIVEKTVKEVMIDTKRRYKAMGNYAFCNGNLDTYNQLQDIFN